MMLKAGFRHIFVGIETSEEKSLLECGKTQNLKGDLMVSVKELHAAGFMISGGFIIGFDSDSPAVFQKQRDFIQQSGIVIATINLLKAPIGTELYKRMKLENRLLDSLNFNENMINLVPEMDIEILYENYRDLINEIYSPLKVRERSQIFLDTFQNCRVKTHIQGKIKPADFITLFKLIFLIGIFWRGRLQFWKLLHWTHRKHPSHLRLAFLFGVLMYHYQKLQKNFNILYNSRKFRAFIQEIKVRQKG